MPQTIHFLLIPKTKIMMKQLFVCLMIGLSAVAMLPAQENKQRPATDYPMTHDPVVAFCEGKYYLFTTGFNVGMMQSDDLCCRGKNSTYKVVVGRAKEATGPYIDREGISLMEGGGTLVVEGNERYAGAGHSATVSFNGKDYLFFHGYDMEDNSRAHLLIREITWDAEGWPSVTL